MQPDFQPAPDGAFISAICTPFVRCPDCGQALTPTIAAASTEGGTGVVIPCQCRKLWRIGFLPMVEVAPPPRISVATQMPVPAGKTTPTGETASIPS